MKSLIPEVILDEIVKSVKNLRPFQTRILKDYILSYDPTKDKGTVVVISTPRKSGKSFLWSAFEEVFKREQKEKEWQEKYGKEKVIFT